MIFQTDRPIYQICAVVLLLAFGLWLTQDLISPRRLFAQSSAIEYLQKGKTHWENLEVDEAILALEKALQMNLTRNTDKIEAHKILAFCWATKRDSKKAEAEFKKILQLNPNFRLPDNESPIFLEPFRQAKAKETPKDTAPPEIYLVEPDPVKEKTPLTITATITDETGVEWVMLYHRVSGQARYASMEMDQKGNNRYTAQIRANSVKSPGIEYYIEASDTKNNPVSSKGSKYRPLLVQVVTTDKTPPEIVHRPVSDMNEGEPLTVTATITDNTSVTSALLHFKSKSERTFRILSMTKIQKNTYQAQISSNNINPPELAYYITAKDGENNSSEWKNARNPFRVTVKASSTLTKIEEPSKPEAEKKTTAKPKKKKGFPILGILLGVVVIGGGVAALVLKGGEEESPEETEGDILIDPPDWPD